MKFKKKDIFIILGIIVFFVILYFAIHFYIQNRFDYYIVNGNSMLPNIQDQARVKVDKNKKISRYDIVVLKVGESILVKRVIGLPGDTLKYTKDDKLYINDEEVKYPFEIQGTTRNIEEEIKLDYQFHYVLGDNRENAYDSRSFGKVSRSQIIGVVVKIDN